MFRQLLAAVSIIYCLTLNAQELLVQSSVVSDLYGNSIATYFIREQDKNYMPVFNARQFAFDSSVHSRNSLRTALLHHSERLGVDTLIYLGEPMLNTGLNEVYVPMPPPTEFNDIALRAAQTANPRNTNVYVINDNSYGSRSRKVLFAADLDLEHYHVRTLQELRLLMRELDSLPRGTVVLNAFSLLDDWNKPVGFAQVEREFVQSNTKHVEVGVCRPGFRTAFALGPSSSEAALIAYAYVYGLPRPTFGSCVNLERAVSRWSSVYRATMGQYDEVQ